MAKNPILPLYYNDINSSTEHWSDEEFGAYMRLLIHQWDKGSIPEDATRLKRIAATAKKHWKLLKEKFIKGEDGLLRNARMEEIRINREKFISKQKENVRKRHTKPLPNPLPESYQTSTKPPTKPLPLEDENENEKNLGKSENPLPPTVGVERAREVAREVWTNERWRNDFCMAMSMDENELQKWMAQFNISICNDPIKDFDSNRYRKIFRGWINSERAKGVTLMQDQNEQAMIPKRFQKINQ